MVKIKRLGARSVLDSRGQWTLEVVLQSAKGTFKAAVPKGASTGQFEALELPAEKAVVQVNSLITKRLVGKSFASIAAVDSALLSLDGSSNKQHLGANALLGVSLAFSRALAAEKKLELFDWVSKESASKKPVLPVPFLNVLNGGKHAGLEWDLQEFLIVPHQFHSFSAALDSGVRVFLSLKKILKEKWGASAILVGDEGGFVPAQARTPEQRLDLLDAAIEAAGFSQEVGLALDCAASEFFIPASSQYQLGEKTFSAGELVDYYAQLVDRYPIVSIEDGLGESDWSGWQVLSKKLGSKIEIIGDDLLVTNPARIHEAVQKKACNALLLKPNQIGTVSESIAAFQLAQKNDWKTMVSHRSGETTDDFVADLAVGLGCGQCKFGAPNRGERVAKYNRLLEIEVALGKKAVFGRL